MAVVFLDHPEKPLARKLTVGQFALLDRVCRTNGGGVHVYQAPKARWKSLMDRHLVQGKLNDAEMVVNTREGLELWRSTLSARKEN